MSLKTWLCYFLKGECCFKNSDYRPATQKAGIACVAVPVLMKMASASGRLAYVAGVGVDLGEVVEQEHVHHEGEVADQLLALLWVSTLLEACALGEVVVASAVRSRSGTTQHPVYTLLVTVATDAVDGLRPVSVQEVRFAAPG